MSEKGLAWGAVGNSVKENQTIENMARIFRAAKDNGFEVFISPHYFVVKDATAGPRHPEWGDGYQAALINFSFLAHAVLLTDEVVKAMK